MGKRNTDDKNSGNYKKIQSAAHTLISQSRTDTEDLVVTVAKTVLALERAARSPWSLWPWLCGLKLLTSLKRVSMLAVTCFMLTVLLTAGSCGPVPDSNLGSNHSTSTVSTTPAVVPPHRNHLTVGYCADGTWSVPTTLFTGANRFVADSIDQGVTLNQDGLTVFETYVSAHPYLPQNTFTITVPALPAPPTPNIAPTPTPNPNNVYGSSAAQSTVTAVNAQAEQAYQAQMAQLNAQLAATKAQVKTQTDRLRKLPRPAGAEATQTSLWSCIELQAQRLQQTHDMPGKALLLVESDFEDTLPAAAMAGVRLDGVPVIAIFMNCHSGADCAAKQTTWGSVFRRMHAASWRFYDPGASATLGNPFLGRI